MPSQNNNDNGNNKENEENCHRRYAIKTWVLRSSNMEKCRALTLVVKEHCSFSL